MKTQILVCGVRHRTAPIAVRECFAIREDELHPAIDALKAQAAINEVAIVTTCNRTEMYIACPNALAGYQAVEQFFRSFKGLDLAKYQPHLFKLLDDDAAYHLFRVASGLDSLIVGEGQILGQVKDALATAQKAKSTGVYLNKLFKTAITVGKRVRTETGITDKDVSVSRAAFEFAKKQDSTLFNRQIALVGGGKMAEILMHALRQEMSAEQLKQVSIVNRSERRLETLSQKHGLTPVPWPQLDDVLQKADVLFVATGAPHIIFGTKHFENRGDKLIIDIAVPRNVDPRVGDLPNVTLVNTDNLSDVIGFSDEAKQHIQTQAQQIVMSEYAQFCQWMLTLPSVTTINKLQAKLEDIRVGGHQKPAAETEQQAHQSKVLIKKILHEPIVRLRAASSTAEMNQHVDTLTQLFNL